MRISDWSSDVCSSDLARKGRARLRRGHPVPHGRTAQLGTSGHRVQQPRHPPEHTALQGAGNRRGDQDLSEPLHPRRSEEHTSELQSLMRISYAVFCLKKKTKNKSITATNTTSLYQTRTPHNIPHIVNKQ